MHRWHRKTRAKLMRLAAAPRSQRRCRGWTEVGTSVRAGVCAGWYVAGDGMCTCQARWRGCKGLVYCIAGITVVVSHECSSWAELWGVVALLAWHPAGPCVCEPHRSSKGSNLCIVSQQAMWPYIQYVPLCALFNVSVPDLWRCVAGWNFLPPRKL